MIHESPELRECVENCSQCHRVCLDTLTNHCMEMGGDHTEPSHVRLMMDCAQICETAMDFMLRRSEEHSRVCGVCAEICRKCADDCARVGDMRDCVDACVRCADSCGAMAVA